MNNQAIKLAQEENIFYRILNPETENLALGVEKTLDFVVTHFEIER